VLEISEPRPQEIPRPIPILLAGVAGFIDSCTVLALFGLFVAQVTGSFVLAAVAFVTHEQGALIKVLAIPVFLAAAAVVTVITVIAARHRRRALVWALGFECIVLTGFTLAAVVGEPLTNPNAAPVVIASLLGLFAMGAQSAMVRLTMRGVASTNVMTTNTTQVAIDATELLLAWRASRRSTDAATAAAYRAAQGRIAALLPIMLAFLFGTAAGTLAHETIGLRGLIAPLLVVYGVLAWAVVGRRGKDVTDVE
jgi:uncharacterized membrane protein YoaK (UPF0700 family)